MGKHYPIENDEIKTLVEEGPDTHTHSSYHSLTADQDEYSFCSIPELEKNLHFGVQSVALQLESTIGLGPSSEQKIDSRATIPIGVPAFFKKLHELQSIINNPNQPIELRIDEKYETLLLLRNLQEASLIIADKYETNASEVEDLQKNKDISQLLLSSIVRFVKSQNKILEALSLTPSQLLKLMISEESRNEVLAQYIKDNRAEPVVLASSLIVLSSICMLDHKKIIKPRL